RSTEEREISIAMESAQLEGTLSIPENATGIVLFAHGSGSSRNSPRNRYVARTLHSRGVATLLFDLLTTAEERVDRVTAEHRFDIRFLADRLIGATQWVMMQPDLAALDTGYFGASTGAAAALVAAAEHCDKVSAVVSRGGRPDLAGDALKFVQAPTLLIVGGEDGPVIRMNREALAKIRCAEKKLVIVPGATHLFEEPGALEEVARLAADWFTQHLSTIRNRQAALAARF
ncbi:MAG TPA: dienelactone hydrolase family protein, partial [Candidatus Acidoferrum sp.]|nr:dienelactone hydrolase family protein [Candidatus Acidoferrum sp.]